MLLRYMIVGGLVWSVCCFGMNEDQCFNDVVHRTPIQELASMNCSSIEFVNFLSNRHYLDGSRDVSSQKDKNFITNCANRFTDDDIFSDTTLHSFADNIAFVVAQTGQIDRAAQILLKSYEEDQSDDNWLFEEIKQKNEEITSRTIKASLIDAYGSENKQ